MGYAAIQENFAERDAIKVIPHGKYFIACAFASTVLGAFLIDYVSWHWGFVAIALLALLSWVGLKKQMPSHKVSVTKQPFSYLLMTLKGI